MLPGFHSNIEKMFAILSSSVLKALAMLKACVVYGI